VKEVVDAAKDAVLGDERAAPLASEEGMDCSMVVNQKMEGTALAEGSKGEGFVSCKQFCGLLGDHPGWARKEASAHALFPDTNIEGTPRGLGCICKEMGSGGGRHAGKRVTTPRREGHGKGF
jgi:hypothetical protein